MRRRQTSGFWEHDQKAIARASENRRTRNLIRNRRASRNRGALTTSAKRHIAVPQATLEARECSRTAGLCKSGPSLSVDAAYTAAVAGTGRLPYSSAALRKAQHQRHGPSIFLENLFPL